MNGLDLGALELVRQWARTRLDRHERRTRMAPLFDAMQAQIRATMEYAAEFTAGPEAEVRKSVLRLEASLDEFASRYQAAEAKVAAALESARARTSALREWLEAVS